MSISGMDLDKSLAIAENSCFELFRRINEIGLEILRKNSTPIPYGRSTTRAEIKIEGGKRDPRRLKLQLSSPDKEILSKTKTKANEIVNDRLALKTRRDYYSRLQTVGKIQKELERRENVLVNSVGEIKMYLRAVSSLNQIAELMYCEQKKSLELQDRIIRDMEKRFHNIITRKKLILKYILAFDPAKFILQRELLDLERYPTVEDLVHFYLVLIELQKDILKESEDPMKEEIKQIVDFQRQAPLILKSKDSTILDLKCKLRIRRQEVSHLNEQIDMSISTRLKENRDWFEIQRWIKVLFESIVEMRLLGPQEPDPGYLNMLYSIMGFVADAQELVTRFKKS